MKKYIITEYPELIRKYLVKGKSKKDAYNNFCLNISLQK